MCFCLASHAVGRFFHSKHYFGRFDFSVISTKKIELFALPSFPKFVKKKYLPAGLARRATGDLNTLARRIILLAPGYRTALSSRPANE